MITFSLYSPCGGKISAPNPVLRFLARRRFTDDLTRVNHAVMCGVNRAIAKSRKFFQCFSSSQMVFFDIFFFFL